MTEHTFEAGLYYRQTGPGSSSIQVVEMDDGVLGYWTSPHIPVRPLEGTFFRPDGWTEITEKEFWG